MSRILALALLPFVLPGTAFAAGDTLNLFWLDDSPCLSLVAREDGDLLAVRLVLRTEIPVAGFVARLRFDPDELSLVACAPGELMHVGGCVAHLTTEECKGGCAIEARVLEGTAMIGCGDAVELTFRREGKDAVPRLGRIDFILDDGEQQASPRGTTRAGRGTEESSWAAVKVLYR